MNHTRILMPASACAPLFASAQATSAVAEATEGPHKGRHMHMKEK